MKKLTWFYILVLCLSWGGAFLDTVWANDAQLDSLHCYYSAQIQGAESNDTLLMDALFAYGESLDDIGETELAVEQFETLWKLAQENDDIVRAADVGNYLASLYWEQGECEKSTSLYLEALAFAQKSGRVGTIAKIGMNLACNYSLAGDYENAITHALKALELKESNRHLEMICYHYINVANIFRESGNTVKWREYLLKAYALKDVEGCASAVDVAKIYNSLGSLAHEQNDLTAALGYFDTLLMVSREHDFQQGISTAFANMASVYKDLGELEKALALTEEAEAYLGDHTYEHIYNNNWKALLHKELGSYAEALKLVEANLARKDIGGYATEKLKAIELCYELNYLLGQYQEAFRWNDSLRVNESRFRDERVRGMVEDLETQYQMAQKEMQIELLEAENEVKTQRIRMGMGLLVLFSVLGGFGFYTYRMKQQQAFLLQTDLQQKLLRSQMNPHFLFNALSSIQCFMYQKDTELAAGYLGNFAALTRGILEHSRRDFIPLCAELKVLENYLELEVMRLDGKVAYQIEVDEQLDCDLHLIPPLVIQPFVENCIKHAFTGITYQGIVFVRLQEEKNHLVVVVEDNGLGFAKAGFASTTEHKSMSMAIFNERRLILEKRLGSPISFEVVDLSDRTDESSSGSRVIIHLPLLTNQNLNHEKNCNY